MTRGLTPTTVLLQLRDFNVLIKTSYSIGIFDLSYSNFALSVQSKFKSNYFGLIFKNEFSGSKECYVFSLDLNLANHASHAKLSKLFGFNCEIDQDGSRKCDRFATEVKDVIGNANFYKSVFIDDVKPIDKRLESLPIDDDEITLFDSCKRKVTVSPKYESTSKEGNASKSSHDCCTFDDFIVNHDVSSTINEEECELPPFSEAILDKDLMAKFMIFLKLNHCSENLSFFQDVSHYRKVESDFERANIGEDFIKKYFCQESENVVNVGDHIKIIIVSYGEQNNFPTDLFDVAHHQIAEMLKFDLWPRFVKSEVQRNENLISMIKNCTTENSKPQRSSLHRFRLTLFKRKRDKEPKNTLISTPKKKETAEDRRLSLGIESQVKE
uniref:RGS domain-containing protein n=1 Tax=Rhabditophanes sp. KR3021 TaxID=114890 RepID=A0AC35U1M9_9BILA